MYLPGWWLITTTWIHYKPVNLTTKKGNHAHFHTQLTPSEEKLLALLHLLMPIDQWSNNTIQVSPFLWGTMGLVPQQPVTNQAGLAKPAHMHPHVHNFLKIVTANERACWLRHAHVTNDSQIHSYSCTYNEWQDVVCLAMALGMWVQGTANHPGVPQDFKFEHTDNGWSV